MDSPPASGSSGSAAAGSATLPSSRRRRCHGRDRRAGFGHRVDGHLDAQVELLLHAGVDDRHVPLRADETDGVSAVPFFS